MRGSPYGKWVIGHRFQAHVVVPGLVVLVLIVLYFFGNQFLQNLVAPGVYPLPLVSGSKLGVSGFLKAWCLLWTLFLCVRTIVVTIDLKVRLAAIAITVAGVMMLLSWVDGNALISRVWSGLTESGAPGTDESGLLGVGWLSVGFVLTGLVSILFYAVVPLLYGGSRNAVTAMLVPNRWMIASVALMFVIFKVAHGLQAQGWGAIKGVEGALGADVSLFMVLIFLYMTVLYTAEMNYLAVVRKEAPRVKWRF